MNKVRIIVSLDLRWCLSHASCKLLIHEGGIRITKSGRISGCLHRYNPFSSRSISQEAKSLTALLQRSYFIQTDTNEFLSSWRDFRESAKELCEIGILCLKNEQGKYIKIDSVDLLEGREKCFISSNHKNALLLAWPENEVLPTYTKKTERPLVQLQRFGKHLGVVLHFRDRNNKQAEDSLVDYKERAHFEHQLLDLGLLRKRKDIFTFPKDKSEVELINALIETGAEVYYTDNRKVKRASNASSSFSYGLDWFHVNFKVETDSGEEDISDIILRHQLSDFVRIGDQIVRVPPSLKERRWRYDHSKQSGALKIHKSDLLYAEELAAETQSSFSPSSCMKPYETVSCELPASLDNLLKPYQREGAKWLKYLYVNRFGGILADDMGLGKTVQAIAFMTEANVTSLKLPALVVTTRSLVTNWIREIEKFAPQMHPVRSEDADFVWTTPPAYQARCIVITTYSQVRLHENYFAKHSFKFAIYDEIQLAKNSESQTYHALRRLHPPFSIGLSGTPLENNLSELWSVFSLVNPFLLGSKDIFIHKYSRSLPELRRRISPFMLRRTKAEVLSELPPYTEQVVYCDLLPAQSSLYKSLHASFRRDLCRKLKRNEIYDSSRWLRYLLYLRMACSHPVLLPFRYNPNHVRESCKFDYVVSKVIELSACGQKSVIFGQFLQHMHLLRQTLCDSGITTFYVDGATQSRQEVIDNFSAADNAVLIASLKTGGIGLNMTSASCAFILDPWWNPAAEKQAADRLYRIGQRNPVKVYRLIAANTIEDKILQLQRIKQDIFSSVVKGSSSPRIEIMKEINNYIMSCEY